MSDYTDRIKPTNSGLTTYIDDLSAMKYQIPTFQRDVVWEPYNVKKLWDSIYKFYPLGSILVWKTPIKLQNHRSIGGHIITDNTPKTEYQYILDGQQRTTSLMTSLLGGTIAGRPGFDPQLYIDLTIPLEDETDDESFKERFLFWSEIDDNNGENKHNKARKEKYDKGLIVKLYDVVKNYNEVQTKVFKLSQDFSSPEMTQLGLINQVINNYRLSFIEVKGIQVNEVCQIFERINQAGKPLNIFDIVVAKTFIPEENGQKGFYLREIIDDFRKTNKSNFMNIEDLDFLRIIAILINQNVPNSGIYNITDRYLNDIKTEQILSVWDDAKTAILKTFDFFENHLHLLTPALIPFGYFYITLTSYFFRNKNPDYNYITQYFWFECLHNDDLLSNTTQLFEHLKLLKTGTLESAGTFVFNKEKFRAASYSSKGRMSRAILSLYASKNPKDWKFTDRSVIVHNYFESTDNPNLHHIFPTESEFVRTHSNLNQNSLMNIAYITQLTNLEFTNDNPTEYLKEYVNNPDFIAIMPDHFLPKELVEWVKDEKLPEDAINTFIERRIELIEAEVRKKLSGIAFQEIDTRVTE